MASKQINKIGVLTSGGDCSGLNSAIRGIIKRSLKAGIEVWGIQEGTVGLMQDPLGVVRLDSKKGDDFNMLLRGGTILKTINKGDPFAYLMPDGSYEDASDKIVAGYQKLGLDALIAIGGDGSMRIIEKIADKGGIHFIGIPKTIDNDVPVTDFPIGYMTAVDTVMQSIDRLHDTALSHNRIMVVEVMGRDVGHLALSSGIAGGADVILIPEIAYDINIVAQHIRNVYATGRTHAIVVCAEAAHAIKENSTFINSKHGNKIYGGIAYKIGEQLEQLTGFETRVTVLGHVQRGGTPVALDRLIASAFGVKAVECLLSGKDKRVLVWRNNTIQDIDLSEITNNVCSVDTNGDLIQVARGLGINFGDAQ